MQNNIKKYNRVLKYALLFSAIVFVLSSCQKFLKEKPTGQITSDYSFSSASEGAALVTGTYRSLASYTGGAGDYGNFLPCTMEYPTGFCYTTDAHPQFFKFQTNQTAGGTLSDYDNFWNNNYQGVRDCNLAISKIPGIKDWTASQQSAALGEVRTLRAFYYFLLVRYYGDLVMDTSVLKSVADAQQPRVSLKDIYDQVIIPDLEYAVNSSSLADAQSGNGRITKYISRAILADVYLTCAGYPYQEVATDPTKPWCTGGLFTATAYPVNTPSAISFLQKAQTQLNALYGKYTLGTYRDLHTPGNINNKGEAIFQAQYLGGVNDMSGFVNACLPVQSHISQLGDEYGTDVPTLGYINSYNPADKRIQERQMFFTSDTYAKKFDPNQGPADKFAQPYVYKYYDSAAIKNGGGSNLNFTFYRYADILLMLTEVNWSLRQLGVTVSDNDIVKGINEVRERALLPDYLSTDINLKSIMSERAYELIFETKMLWDQRRTRTCLVDGQGSFSALESFFGHQPPGFSFAFSAMNLLCPISQNEIAVNSKCLQNFNFLPKQVGQ
ncbi:MAG: RagB/SusD family nutrient uptake outer membrane protein [Bacteroidota bacterium]|nr:RagB/SusD family nutrient uptake outer membrane protein [Bacteroidota bacterium]